MLICVNLSEARSEVLEPDDFQSLSVRLLAEATAANPSMIDVALGDLGSCDSLEHTWLDIDALKRVSGRANDPAWVSSFDAMISYAMSKGWTDNDGTSVRAHIESA